MFQCGIKKPIPQLSIVCLNQSINTYVQIHTYWRYILRIMTRNILLLASTICFLANQELVGAGMNCRALLQREEIFSKSSNQKQKLHVAPCLLTD